MEESSESGNADTSSGCEDLRRNINAPTQTHEDSSDIAYKITLEPNSMIVNKMPSSSSVHLNQSSTNVEIINEASINVSDINQPNISPSNLNVDRSNSVVLTTKSNNTSITTSGLNIQPLALNLTTNSPNYFQQFGNKSNINNSNQLNMSTTAPPKSISNIHQFDEDTIFDSFNNPTNSPDQNQPPSILEFLRQSLASSTNTNQEAISKVENSIKSMGKSVEVENTDKNLFKPTKPSDMSDIELDPSGSKPKIKLYAEDRFPVWHVVDTNVVTPPIITENLSKVFADFPIFGKPKNKADRESFQDRMIRKFVGCNLDDAEYKELKEYCSVDHLRTGRELILPSKIPTVGPICGPPTAKKKPVEEEEEKVEEPNLFVLEKLKLRMEDPDIQYAFTKKLKYRGCRIIPISTEDEPANKPPNLEPGQDILYRVRVYRPYCFMAPKAKRLRGRHSVFSCDMYMVGRQSLWELRDRLVCRNDGDLRIDASDAPDVRPNVTAKELFPSGFLFINNVFYVDRRAACRDTSAELRRWAAARGLGPFRLRDMALALRDVSVRLAHPEVYVHQGDCEHVFLFSEVRLLSYNDPLHLSCYPYFTSVSQNQVIYCSTCSDFGAKWIVVGHSNLPFDPAFFCEHCFRDLLYKNKSKFGNFKAYSYRGNEMRAVKPQVSDTRRVAY